MAAAAGVLVHVIYMLACWSSEAYVVYVHTPQETLAAVSWAIAKAFMCNFYDVVLLLISLFACPYL